MDTAKGVGLASGQELSDEFVAQVAQRVQGREQPPREPAKELTEHKETHPQVD